jgi:hypothetical protein
VLAALMAKLFGQRVPHWPWNAAALAALAMSKPGRRNAFPTN